MPASNTPSPTPRKTGRKSLKAEAASAEARKAAKLKQKEEAKAKAAARKESAAKYAAKVAEREKAAQARREQARAAKQSKAAQAKPLQNARYERRVRLTGDSGAQQASAKRKGAAAQKNAKAPAQQTGFQLPSLWTNGASGGKAIGGVQGTAKGAGRHASQGKPSFALAVSFPVRVAVLVVFALLLVGLVDMGLNWDKAFPGTKIGQVDVSGATKAEAAELVKNAYQPCIDEGEITIYAGEQEKEDVESGNVTDIGPEEQLSVDQVDENAKKWDVEPSDLDASIDYNQLAEQAVEHGRSDGGIFARLLTLIAGATIPVDVSYDEDKIEKLAKKIDKKIGDPREDYDIDIDDGVATVTEGHDGYMVDRTDLQNAITDIILGEGKGTGSFLANAPYAPLRIDEEQAQQVCDMVNAAIADGAAFVYKSESWTADAEDLGKWTRTKVEEQSSGSWKLVPYINEDKAKASLLKHVKETVDNSNLVVTFSVSDDDDVTVGITGDGEMPQTAEAIAALDAGLYGISGQQQDGAKEADGTPVSIQVETTNIPSLMDFDDALYAGVIEEISSFTTEYNTGEGTKERVNNIHVAADELNNSVCAANGGKWSFNDIAGESTEDKGFMAAGSILDGEYVDSIGGGVCQVATTVFNCVYEAGYAIPTRHNHTLYIEAYPEGRDAAVSWPDLDLIWENDTESDVILRTSHTDNSVTAALYGVSPDYKVTSDVGDWEDGKAYKVKVEEDSDLAEGAIEIQTTGVNGSKISVIRTVKDSDGNVVREDEFDSEYEPKDYVILHGPNTKVDKKKYQSALKSTSDSDSDSSDSDSDSDDSDSDDDSDDSDDSDE